ncbi:MAG TPA: lyase family protein, partial [Candidatus Polarisedimenticolaceae bacterium]|nr:lyase family protein [Candidatus Polarisedimenticolaceae bacterium]
MATTTKTRTERDTMGEMEVPAEAYYGASTQRAVINFPVSGLKLPRRFLRALGMIKRASAEVNRELGLLDPSLADAIAKAAREVEDGSLDAHFPLDVFQTGSGTSTNMNANEVIANRALELMGHRKGEYRHCDPHDHVNASQSTNDAYPSALHVGMALGNVQLRAAINELIAAFRAKGGEFGAMLKMGRTQLQDAVPMTLGQEFEAFAETLAGEVRALEAVHRVLCEVNMGATAIGTGLTAPDGYAQKCTAHLAAITSLPIHLADNLIEATQDTQA